MKKEEVTFEEIRKIARTWEMAKDLSEAMATVAFLKDKDSDLSVDLVYRSYTIVHSSDMKIEIAEMYKDLIKNSLKTFKEICGISYYEFLKQNEIK